MGKLKSFEILFNNNKSVYYPGDELNGKCVIELKNGEFKLNTIKVYMRGVAKVHWTESRSSGNRLGAYTEHFSAEIEYFLKKQTLLANVNNENGQTRELVLSEGLHEFPFSFQLPSGAISTSFEGKYGSVRYWVKAEIEKPWSFTSKTKKGFTVISPIDINQSEYLNRIGSGIEKSLCCWCCISGPISLYAQTDRRGYCPGESIAITADFENHSNRTVVPRATFCQNQTFIASGKVRTRKIKYTSVTGAEIEPGKRSNWDSQPLKIPPVSPSITNCSLIKVDYNVRLKLKVNGGYSIFIDLPVVIGTVPLRRRPPGYSDQAPMRWRETSFHYLPLPSYDELRSQYDLPPSYTECISGSVDIRDDEDGDDIIGDTSFTPMYLYINQAELSPPPEYSELNPCPTHDS